MNNKKNKLGKCRPIIGIVTGDTDRAGKPNAIFVFTSKTPSSLFPEAGFKEEKSCQLWEKIVFLLQACEDTTSESRIIL